MDIHLKRSTSYYTWLNSWAISRLVSRSSEDGSCILMYIYPSFWGTLVPFLASKVWCCVSFVAGIFKMRIIVYQSDLPFQPSRQKCSKLQWSFWRNHMLKLRFIWVLRRNETHDVNMCWTHSFQGYASLLKVSSCVFLECCLRLNRVHTPLVGYSQPHVIWSN